MNKNIIYIVVGLLLLIGIFVFFQKTNVSAPATDTSPTVRTQTPSTKETVTPTTQTNETPTTPTTQTAPTTPTQTTTVDSNAVALTVSGDNFKFAPSALTVKKGQTVTLTLNNTGGFHDLKIDEFGVATPKIQGPNSTSITFVADKAGSFEYYCSVGNHRAMGMKGTLTVTE